MSEKGRAPFGGRKRKKLEVEDIPVIEIHNVPVDTPPPAIGETEALLGRVTPDEDSGDIVHEFQRLPVKTITLGNVEVSPMANIPQMARRPLEEPEIIHLHNVEVKTPREVPTPEPIDMKLTNEATGRATLIVAAATPPQKKGEKKVIRGQ